MPLQFLKKRSSRAAGDMNGYQAAQQHGQGPDYDPYRYGHPQAQAPAPYPPSSTTYNDDQSRQSFSSQQRPPVPTAGGSWEQQNATYGVDNLSIHDASHQRQAQNINTIEEDGQQFETTGGYQYQQQGGNDGQIAGLRAEIKRLQADADAEQRTLDDMLKELTTVQDELDDAKARLAAKESECAGLRAHLAQIQSQSPVMMSPGSNHSGLSTSHSPWGQPQAHQPSPSPEIQQRINELMVSLGIKDELLRAREAELADERTARATAARELQATQAAVAKYEHENRGLADMLMTAQAGPSPAEASRRNEEVEQLRQQVQFFKANSERVGRQVRDLKDANRTQGEYLAAKTRELADEKSLSLALRMQTGAA